MLSHRGEDVEAITATSNSCEALQTWSGVHRMETGDKIRKGLFKMVTSELSQKYKQVLIW